MIKTLAAIGIFTAGSALSVCDLCGPSGARVTGNMRLGAIQFTERANDKSLRGAISQAAQTHATVAFDVKGMTCAGCEYGVRKVLTRLPGVSNADVSYEHRRALVTYDPGKVTVEKMIAAIQTLGYKATVNSQASNGGINQAARSD